MLANDIESPLLPGGKRSWMERTFSPLTPSGVRSSILNFCSSTLGAGLLSLPYAMSACGVVTGSVLMVLVGVSFLLFYSCIVRVSEFLQVFTYVGMMEASFGRRGKLVTEVVILLFMVGALAIMDTILCSFGLRTLQELGLVQDPESQQARGLFLLAVVMCVQLPLVMPEKVQSLRFASSVSLCCVLYVALLVICQAPTYMAENTTPIAYFRWDLKALDAIGVIFFSFDNALIIPVFYDELSNRKPKRMVKVLKRSFGLLVLLYLALGVLGYLSYAGNMPDLVVLRPSLQGTYDWPMLVGRVVYIMTLMMQIPFCLYPLRLATQQFIGGSNFERNDRQYYLLTLTYLVVPMCIAILVPQVIIYFKVLGSVFALLTGIVFPCKF